MSGRIFISHAGGDERAANAVADHLRGAGLTPLLDRERIRVGESFLSFMENALATSDYVLLLWSAMASTRQWVQVEWEAALHRSIAEARGFLVVGRLDTHPLPHLLAPRLFVELHPELLPGVARLVDMWRSDLQVESRSGRPVASNVGLPQGADGVTVYVTSELFGVALPLSVDLSVPAGLLVRQVTHNLSLPSSLDVQGKIGVRFDYRLLHNDTALEFGRPLEAQGVQAGAVLWLEFSMVPFANVAPHAGVMDPLTFRGDAGTESRAMRSAQRRLAAAIRAANLAP
jgi:hypothetical protein